MPNQLNYPNKVNTNFQRPSRIRANDIKLIAEGNEQILYGTRDKDNVEIWAYNPNGTFAGHALLRPIDPALTLTTVVDNSGPNEVMNVDMRTVAVEMGLPPGRYAVVMNFLRDEVGSEDGYKLYISKISRDRTEVRLKLVDKTEAALLDIYEFIVPSAPKRFAQAVIDQAFGVSLDAGDDEKIRHDTTMGLMNQLTPKTWDRVQYADANSAYLSLFETVRIRARNLVLDRMAADVFNFSIQEVELLSYVQKAINDVIYDMKQKGEIDPRFDVS
jgi:hypothetical protein